MLANRITSTVGLSKDDWLTARWNNGFGASDASAILGHNPYRSARQAFDEFVGVSAGFEGNEATELGELLEDPCAVLYTRRTGKRVERVRAILQHPDYPFMLANLDRRVVGERKVLEIKTAGLFAHMHGDWGDPQIEPDRIPTQFLDQVQQQMAVTGYERADLALLVGGQKFFVYSDIPRDETYIGSIIKLEAAFWDKVLQGRAALAEIAAAHSEVGDLLAELRAGTASPEVLAEVNAALDPLRPLPSTYNEASERWEPQRKAIQATPAIVRTFDAFCSFSDDASAIKKSLDAVKTELANYMQDCDELLIDGKAVLTWRNVTRKGYFVAESTSRQMRRVKAK